MKKLILLVFAIMSFFTIKADISEIESFTEGSDTFAGFLKDVQDSRELRSSSKFLIEYSGEWPEDMKGAFEYAVKLWEEQIPIAVPIKITARVGKLKGVGSNVLSTIDAATLTSDEVAAREKYAYTFTALKSSILKEYNLYKTMLKFRGVTNVFKFITNNERTDFQINYNESILDQLSFNLDGSIENKYDFVTLALRDILLGLGFATRFNGNMLTGELIFQNEYGTPFEEHIRSFTGTDPYEAFKIATSGVIHTKFGDLYAPETFINGKSLQLFYPEDDLPLTQLLCYDFPKGYVMRDLSSYDWDSMFHKDLEWKNEIMTGGGGSVSESGSSENILPFNGVATLSLNDFSTLMTLNDDDDDDGSGGLIDMTEWEPDDQFRLDSICAPYYLGLDKEEDNMNKRVILSVQRKDGSWEPVWAVGYMGQPLQVDFSTLSLELPEDMYARSTSGNLRYRLVEKTPDVLTSYNSYRVKYFTREFSPQTPVLKYKGMTGQSTMGYTTYSMDDDYIVDIEIGMSNLEGIDRLSVEQTFEGESYPFVFEVQDFKKGTFTATVIKGLSTKFQVLAYNDHGVVRSKEIIVPALPFETSLSFSNFNDHILVKGLSERLLINNEIVYTISSPTVGSLKQGVMKEEPTINTSDLNKGVYILSLSRNGVVIGSTKFVK